MQPIRLPTAACEASLPRYRPIRAVAIFEVSPLLRASRSSGTRASASAPGSLDQLEYLNARAPHLLERVQRARERDTSAVKAP